MRRRTSWPIVAVACLALITGCAATPPGPSESDGGPGPAVLADAAVAGLVDSIAHRTPKKLATERLADGLKPPTNRWYSGLVFGAEPQPVFPLPLSFALTGDGFAFGLPKVAVTADSILGGHNPEITVGLGVKRWQVATSDPSVLGIDGFDADGARLGRVTIAQGWPFVAWTAAKSSTAMVPEGFAPEGEVRAATVGEHLYGLAASGARPSGGQVVLDPGSELVFWAVPDGRQPAELAQYAHAITGSALDYRVSDDEVRTTLNYLGDQTAIGRLQHQKSDAACSLGQYQTVLGPMELCPGSQLSWSTARTTARPALDLSRLDEAQRERLGRQLEADVENLPASPADTYFGGKMLQRTAMLLMVADQLERKDLADRLAGALSKELTTWTDPAGCRERMSHCFVYDPSGAGLVGLTPSFGSEEYNDHHFHYGYFLYAAAVLAEHDPSAVPRLAPMLTLIAADLASAGNSYFPDRRSFDAYAGHSWASGTAPFADGNNQESVSEAVNAYAGLSLWAQVMGDEALAREADWMLSLEADSSARYWLAPDLGPFAGYGHRIVSLNWGGKRDYATWFSPEPAAKLGILLLPLSPTSEYLRGDPAHITAVVDEGTQGRFDQKFGDLILAYSALAGPAQRDRAVDVAQDLPASALDDGMSRTMLLAWLYSLSF